LPRKKTRTTFKSLINDSNEIRGRGGEELDAIATSGNNEEELELNVDQIINNIQEEPIVFAKHVVFINEATIIATQNHFNLFNL
jgi:hypothetical protein